MPATILCCGVDIVYCLLLKRHLVIATADYNCLFASFVTCTLSIKYRVTWPNLHLITTVFACNLRLSRQKTHLNFFGKMTGDPFLKDARLSFFFNRVVYVLNSKFHRLLLLLLFFTKFLKCDLNWYVTGFQATVVTMAAPAYTLFF